jgi:hypothetical protein
MCLAIIHLLEKKKGMNQTKGRADEERQSRKYLQQ